MIEVQDLKKSYGDTVALRGISTSIARGEIVGLLGPNGAGKTTTMKILAGYLLPTAGKATVAGFDVASQPIEVQSRIGYLPENAPLYLDMLVQDYLVFAAEVRGLDYVTMQRRVRAAVEECRIGNVMTRPIGELSKGYRQRVGLATAILHDPEILILDEPTNGLDPNQIAEVRDLIRRMGESKTIIVSTHILSEVAATCDRAVIIIDGLIRADGRLDELTHSHSQLVTMSPDDPHSARDLLAAIEGVAGVVMEPLAEGFHRYRMALSEGADVAERVAELVRANSWRLRELTRDDKTLEQVFRELTETTGEVAA